MVRTRKKRRNARRKRIYRRVSRPTAKRRNIPTRRRRIASIRRNPAKGSRHRVTVYRRGRKLYAPRGRMAARAMVEPGTRINRKRRKTTAKRRRYYRRNPRPTIRNIFSRRVINTSVKFAVGMGTGYMVIPVLNKLLPANMRESATGQFKWLGAVDFAVGALMTAFIKNKDVKDVGMVVAGLGVYDLIAANVPMLGLPAVPRNNKIVNQLFGGTTAGEAISASYRAPSRTGGYSASYSMPYRPTSPVARGMSASYAAPYSMTEGLSSDYPAGSGMSPEASALSEIMNV